MTTDSLIHQTSPDVLANKGVPIDFVMTRPDQQGIWEAHPAGLRTTQNVQFTNWTMKELEEAFGSLLAWDQAMTDRLFGSVIKTLSIALGREWPEQRVAVAMVPGRLKDYRLAIAAAQSIAMGRDPKETLRALTATNGDVETETTPETPMPPADAPSNSSTTPDGSAGLTSGPDGWGTVIPATSSGVSPSDSSSPPSSQWQ